MIYDYLVEKLFAIVKEEEDTVNEIFEDITITYKENYTGRMATPKNSRVERKQGYFDFVINANPWGEINHYTFLKEILECSTLLNCEKVWAGEWPYKIASSKREEKLLNILALFMFEQEVNWGGESWQRRSVFSADFNKPYSQRPRDMLMGFISMVFFEMSVEAIPDWNPSNTYKKTPTFKKSFFEYNNHFKWNFEKYKNDTRAVPLVYKYKRQFEDILLKVPDNPNYINTVKCHECGRYLNEKVILYCRLHVKRFKGQYYCFDHQNKHRVL